VQTAAIKQKPQICFTAVLLHLSTIKELTIKQKLFYCSFILLLLQLCGPLCHKHHFYIGFHKTNIDRFGIH